jgi:hypothetical protein
MNFGKFQIPGTQVRVLLGITLALLTYVLAPKSLKKFALNRCQIRRTKKIPKIAPKITEKKTLNFVKETSKARLV